MKTLYLIGGTMGVGKTTVCRELKKHLNGSVFLDGDWCWDANPFLVTEETKRMVLENIVFLLNQFLHCSAYEHVIFCWVMHEQKIIDDILSGIDLENCRVKAVSLVCDEKTLRRRLEKDVQMGIRVPEGIERSVARIPYYESLNTIKLPTGGKTVAEIVDTLAAL